MALAFPQLRLDVGALDHNIAVMAAWSAAHGVGLAPHVKTTMSAPVAARQVAAGAVGLTVATVEQATTVLGWGHRSVQVANEVVDPAGLRRLRRHRAEDPRVRLQCFVDSPQGLAAAQEVFSGAGPELDLLLDVGTPGGRTGVRGRREARQLAEQVNRAPGVRLVGVAGYEGVGPNTRDGARLATVDAHCRRVRDVFLACADLYETGTPVFSLGGSAYPDRVVEHLPDARDVPGTLRLLRSGCYVTHDHGTYAEVGPALALRPALTVRAVVLSAPEPGTIVVGAGRRDLPYDAGMPVLVSARNRDGSAKPAAAGTVRTLFDHHAVLEPATGLGVTDLVDLGISHPCSAFDRWTSYVVTGCDGDAVDVWTTDFRRRTDHAPHDRPDAAGRQ